jgi:hypothetical protein
MRRGKMTTLFRATSAATISMIIGSACGEAPGPQREASAKGAIDRKEGLLSQAIGMPPVDAAAATFLAMQRGSDLLEVFSDEERINVAYGMVNAAEWATPATENVARLGWYEESRGLEGPPENAPDSYLSDWVGSWRIGFEPPLAHALNAQLDELGVGHPERPLRPFGVVRLNQNLASSYRNRALVSVWAVAACSAAAFAEMANAADPSLGLLIDDAIGILDRPGVRSLISVQRGLLLYADFAPLEPAFAEVGVAARAGHWTRATLIAHFEESRAPIMMSGPGWPGFPHIYVVTRADAGGLDVVDSSGENRTWMSWAFWTAATGSPTGGTGIELVP